MTNTSGCEVMNFLRERQVVIYGATEIAKRLLLMLIQRGITPVMIIDDERVGEDFFGYKISGMDAFISNGDKAAVIAADNNMDVIYDALCDRGADLVLTWDIVLSLSNYKQSYSQCGEDMLVYYFFYQILGKDRINYLDLGANDPVWLSNTFFFYENGARGTLVEPNTNLTNKAEILRPGDEVINAGVGVTDGTLDYYMLDANTLNTCSKEEAENYESLGHKIIDVRQIPIIGVNKLLSRIGRLDFMSLDVEGIDFDILKAIDYEKYAPGCICIETAEYLGGKREDFDEIKEFLAGKGYMIFADTYINTVFVQRNLYDEAMEQKRNQ